MLSELDEERVSLVIRGLEPVKRLRDQGEGLRTATRRRAASPLSLYGVAAGASAVRQPVACSPEPALAESPRVGTDQQFRDRTPLRLGQLCATVLTAPAEPTHREISCDRADNGHGARRDRRMAGAIRSSRPPPTCAVWREGRRVRRTASRSRTLRAPGPGSRAVPMHLDKAARARAKPRSSHPWAGPRYGFVAAGARSARTPAGPL